MSLDNAGTVVEHREYDSFGNLDEIYDELGNTKTDVNLLSDIAFAGRDWDNAAELYQNNARWYEPKSGRFISEDPIGFGDGSNVYRYAGNNPILYIDPSGLSTQGHPLNSLAGGYSSGVATPRNRDIESFSFNTVTPFDSYGTVTNAGNSSSLFGTPISSLPSGGGSSFTYYSQETLNAAVHKTPTFRALENQISTLQTQKFDLQSRIDAASGKKYQGSAGRAARRRVSKYEAQLSRVNEQLTLATASRPALRANLRNRLDNELTGASIVDYSFNPDLRIGPTTTYGVIAANPRFQGGLRVAGGLGEATLGSALTATPEPGTTAAGAFLAYRGVDNISTGLTH